MTITAATTPEALAGSPADGFAARALQLTKVYGQGDARVVALDRLTIGIPKGAFTAVMGPSGSGKSTLMHCLAGLDTVTSGEVYVGDVELGRLNDKRLTRLRRDRIGFVFQAYNLVPTLTARENITLPLDIAGTKPDQAWLDTVIDTIGLRDRLTHRPAELSGGQQQRLACARALATRPEIIFADEPTGNLDSRSGAEVLSFLRRSVREMSQTVVMVTHDPVAAGYADLVIFLRDGQIAGQLAEPTAERVLERLRHWPQAAPDGAVPARGAGPPEPPAAPDGAVPARGADPPEPPAAPDGAVPARGADPPEPPAAPDGAVPARGADPPEPPAAPDGAEPKVAGDSQ